ncbi:MAG TPA: pirin family protein [Candidatus Limnocylindria bacterium]|nr:pirin family protein [Candidatus Limnocylindria bacterium]
MVSVRPSAERGRSELGWLSSRHTFSFADYRDPRHMGFSSLRVINEDRVQPGAGFPTHGHHDMEIVTYVVEGALEHEDSMGNGSVIRPGEVQRMTAGTGVTHSEYNPSRTEPVHFLQIWILPERQGLAPGYEQRAFSAAELQGRLRVVASRDGRDGAVTVHQDARLFAARLAPGEEIVHALAPGRHAWVQVVRGELALDGTALAAGDGAAVSDTARLALSARASSELLLFDLA